MPTDAKLTLRRPSVWQIDLIHDADDAGIGWGFVREKGEGGLAATHKKHALTDTGADSIKRDHRAPDRTGVRGHGLHEQQFVCVEVGVLDGGHNITDDLSELHGAQPIET
jgi:hypothetical protein